MGESRNPFADRLLEHYQQLLETKVGEISDVTQYLMNDIWLNIGRLVWHSSILVYRRMPATEEWLCTRLSIFACNADGRNGFSRNSSEPGGSCWKLRRSLSGQ